MEAFLKSLLVETWQSILITGNLFFLLLFPVIICCILLRLCGNFQEKTLWKIGGYRAVLATARIGTPVHELSHLFTALLFFRKIEKVELFKPDPQTGNLGHVVHSYRKGNLVQTLIGTPLIAMAPFFGGSLVLCGLLTILFPGFSLYMNIPQNQIITLSKPFSIESCKAFIDSLELYFRHLYHTLYTKDLWFDWKFYLFFYLGFCVSAHLSPSKTDFQSFWKPAVGVFILASIAIMIARHFSNPVAWVVKYGAEPAYALAVLLYLALVISIIGCVFIYILFILKTIFSRS